jgi:L-iditol 2-dehydrogenase
MKEIILSGPCNFGLHQAPVPDIGAGEVLVKVAYCAICGTDIRILEGKKKKGISYPCVIGHEISGTVCKTGATVTGFQAGDRIGVSPIIPCGHCQSCLSQKENLCQNRLTIGYQFQGGFAEYVRIPAIAVKKGNIRKIPDRLSLEEASLIEPLACCINGVKKAKIDCSDSVLIVGAGTIGQFHLLLCKLHKARFVAVSDPVAHRRERAKECGADLVIDPAKEDLRKTASQCGIGGFTKIIFACAAAAEINQAIDLCAMGGIIVLFSGFSGNGLCTVALNDIHYKEIELTGSSGCTPQDYVTASTLLGDGSIDVKSFISKIFSLEQFSAAYEYHKSGKGFKVLIQT